MSDGVDQVGAAPNSLHERVHGQRECSGVEPVGHRPIVDHHPVGNSPHAIAAFEAIDISPREKVEPLVALLICSAQVGQAVGLGTSNVEILLIELDQDIGHRMSAVVGSCWQR